MPSLLSEGGQRPADGGAGGRISGEGLGDGTQEAQETVTDAESLVLGAAKTRKSSSA